MNSRCFEQAFNEQSRICLKLAELFKQVEQGISNPQPTASRLAVESLLHAVTLVDRPDLKSKLIKELNRLHLSFQRLIDSDQVDQVKLRGILQQLELLAEQLQVTEGKLAQHLRDHDFLNTIRLHQHHPGGICLTEIPAYQLWLHLPETERQRDLQHFFGAFELMQQTVSLFLSLIRDSAVSTSKIAERGFFQTSLDPQQPLQLLRIHLPSQSPFFPETSIGRHGLSLRFYPLKTHDKRRIQTDQTVAFKLSICAL